MGLKILDGLGSAFVGVATQCGSSEEPVAVYDRDAIIENIMKDGVSREEADEFISYNIEGAYLGEGMPFILSRISLEDFKDATDGDVTHY